MVTARAQNVIRVGRAARRKARRGPYAHSQDNARVVLTVGGHAAAVPTIDPFDRAHLQTDGLGMLVPAGLEHPDRPDLAVRATPRRYPPSQTVEARDRRGRRLGVVGVDSMFDAWYARARRLEQHGIPMGLASAPGAGDAAALLDDLRLRDLIERRLRQRQTPAQIALERAASRLLRDAERAP